MNKITFKQIDNKCHYFASKQRSKKTIQNAYLWYKWCKIRFCVKQDDRTKYNLDTCCRILGINPYHKVLDPNYRPKPYASYEPNDRDNF